MIAQAQSTQEISESRLRDLLKIVLSERFSADPRRWEIEKDRSGSRLVFCCPYCGDSKNPRKKRGNLYLDTLHYKCYNGGCGRYATLVGFLKDFGVLDNLPYDEVRSMMEAAKRAERERRIRGTMDFFVLENYKQALIEREGFKKHMRLKECDEEIKKILRERHQIPDDRFLWNPWKKKLYILNLTADRRYILGFQIRDFSGHGMVPKYTTYKLSTIWETFYREKRPEIIKKAKEIDPISTIFGFSSVDFTKTITAFEGPLDSWLCPNSIALCSVNNPFPFDVENKRWLLDGDKVGRARMRELIQSGETVFLWEKFLRAYNFPQREKWDLNDVVNYILSNGIKIDRLDNYFSNDKWDILLI